MSCHVLKKLHSVIDHPVASVLVEATKLGNSLWTQPCLLEASPSLSTEIAPTVVCHMGDRLSHPQWRAFSPKISTLLLRLAIYPNLMGHPWPSHTAILLKCRSSKIVE